MCRCELPVNGSESEMCIANRNNFIETINNYKVKQINAIL